LNYQFETNLKDRVLSKLGNLSLYSVKKLDQDQWLGHSDNIILVT